MFKSSKNTKTRYPKLKRLQGLMTEYEITVADLAKYIGRAVSTVSKANNGHNLYDSMDMKNIQKLINLKAEKTGKKYTIEEIFY